MRAALLSLQQYPTDDPAALLGGLTLVGRSLAEHQLDLALAAGCERIFCLGAGLSDTAVAMQLRAEKGGASFAALSGPRALLGKLGSADELLVLAEGVLPARDVTLDVIEQGTGIAALPAEEGIAAGFERIDLNYAWGGLLLLPGGLVERLAELPPDCDAVSALLRIALQAQLRLRIVPTAALVEGRWVRIGSKVALAELEPNWVRRHAAPISLFAPGRALVRKAIWLAGPALLSRQIRPATGAVLGTGLAVTGIAAGWWGLVPVGLLLAGAGWLAAEAGAALAPLAEMGGRPSKNASLTRAIPGFIIDLALVAIVALSLSDTVLGRIFAPLILVGLLRLASRKPAAAWRELLADRAVLALGLALLAVTGFLLPGIELLALGVLMLLVGDAARAPRITQA